MLLGTHVPQESHSRPPNDGQQLRPGPIEAPQANRPECGILTEGRLSAEGQRLGHTGAPVAARAGGGRSVNTALVDSLPRNAHPSAAWRLQSRSSLTPLPHPAAPASPTAAPHLRAHQELPGRPPADSRPSPERTPLRGWGRSLRPLGSSLGSWRDGRRARRGRECSARAWNAPPAPGARPHSRGESSRVPRSSAAVPRARLGPAGSQTHTLTPGPPRLGPGRGVAPL